MAGANPGSAAEVNQTVGSLLRQFENNAVQVERFAAWMAAYDLKIPPYNMTAGDEADIKSAIGGLNTSFQAIDRTFITRLTGLY